MAGGGIAADAARGVHLAVPARFMDQCGGAAQAMRIISDIARDISRRFAFLVAS